MYKILLVEDSTEAAQLVQRALGRPMHIEWARTVREASNLLAKKEFDLLLLDAHLPDGDGFHLCSLLQAQGGAHTMPIILLTAKNSISDKVMAFSLGADDFISKPFDGLELKARVEARLRKRESSQIASDVILCGDLEINKRTQKVHLITDGTSREIELTPREFRILLLLASQPNAVLSRDEILNKVWGENVHVYTRSVDTHVSKLRKKLGEKGELINSVHGMGYRLKNEAPRRTALEFGTAETPSLRLGHVG